LKELKSQLEQETNSAKASGVLKLNLTSPIDGKCNFTISYFTHVAGWTPYYDVIVADANKPIKIVSKAKVYQVTGIEWEKVRITLSSAMPSSGKVAPLFSTWFLQYQYANQYSRSNMKAMQNSYSYDKVAMAEELVIVDADVDYDYDEDYYYDDYYEEDMSSMDRYVFMNENQLNLTFNIDLPYTIPGNGKEQSIELKNQEVSASFKYYCTPKLDTETYLLAEIADWEKLNLLSGNANITYDGTYVGTTFIDANSTQTNLALTLGIDRRVSVKREKMKEYSSTRTLGSDVRQEFAYQMTVRNNRNDVARMVLKDQYPISTLKDVTVEILKDTSAPTVNIPETGVVTWEYDMQPGETKTFKLIYSVKYPKGKTINL
jgi:uncharacterized protein (TIGR02231 family)